MKDTPKIPKSTPEATVSIMTNWGYSTRVSHDRENYPNTPWLADVDEGPGTVMVRFTGESIQDAVNNAYVEVSKWQNAKQYPCQTLTERLASWINCEGLENGSNTPDFILAQLLRSVLNNIDTAILQRDNWWGVTLEPGQHRCSVWSEEAHAKAGPIEIRKGLVIKLGKRLWRLTALPKQLQGDDLWVFECTDSDGGIGCDRFHNFTRSELQWLVCHGAMVGQPAEGEYQLL